ncbi:MAG: hypothetical protein JXB13_17120 [Phycisphaerae bacterium]|nr:hypothetical protein [Phycisphaerae bacterium]
MKAQDDNSQMDELISRAVSRPVPPFDFDTWKLEHAETLREYRRRMADREAGVSRIAGIGSIIMRTLTDKAAIAVIVVLVLMGVGWFLTGDSGVAYALEQTIAANRQVRFLHVRTLDPDDENPDVWENRQELWAELGEKGAPVQMRIEEGLGDSFRVIVLQGNLAIRWRPANDEYDSRHVYNADAEMQQAISMFDPRAAAETVDRLVEENKADVRTETTETGEIRLTVSPRSDAVDVLPRPWRVDHTYVILVDPVTRLFKQIDEYGVRDGRSVLQMRFEYLDYNEATDPKLFDLEPPAGAALDDRVTGIGWPQGDLSDAAAAAETVRQYITAKIERNYELAARLHNGQSAAELQKWDEEHLEIRYTRLVWIGEPIADPRAGDRGFQVPYTFELETADGRRELAGPPSEHPEISGPIEHMKASVRPVAGQPDRWIITGGI